MLPTPEHINNLPYTTRFKGEGRLLITIALKPRHGAEEEDMLPRGSRRHHGFADAV
jgi:hypothetical protein